MSTTTTTFVATGDLFRFKTINSISLNIAKLMGKRINSTKNHLIAVRRFLIFSDSLCVRAE